MPLYQYERRPIWGGFTTGTMVKRIIIATVAVFVLQNLLPIQFTIYLSLSPRDVISKFYIWQMLSYMFLHGGLFHLLFNMFIVWMFGSPLESVWGGERFLRYYIGCGLGGALFSFVFAFNHMVLGASAAGFGLLLAYAILFPENYIVIWFLFPVKARHFVAFLAVLQLLMGISGQGGIAYFAHLGGMAAGLFFFRHEVAKWGYMRRFRRLFDSYARSKTSRWEEQERAKVDSILDKIASKGYDELTPTEKRILENYSRKHKDDSD